MRNQVVVGDLSLKEKFFSGVVWTWAMRGVPTM
jgi:hypothetical protein